MQKTRTKICAVALVTAMTMGLSGCEAFVREICGSAPGGGDTIPVSPEYRKWEECSQDVYAGGFSIGVFAVAAAVVIAMIAEGGDGGGGGGGGPATD
jgi:hypothetical protein